MPASQQKLINVDIERVSAEEVRQAAEYQAAILADVAGRRGTLHGRIKPLAPNMAVAGPAITVEVRPGDNLAIHAAMAVAKPGDVLVIDGKGDLSCALLGEIMATQAQASGIAGIIIDGAVRDAETLSKQSFPVSQPVLIRVVQPSSFQAGSIMLFRSRAPRCRRVTWW